MEQLHIVSPAGLQALKTTATAPRLDDLNGKTLGEVWNGVFKGDMTFPIIRRLLPARYPGIRVVPYTDFHHQPGSDVPEQQREIERGIVAAARAKGCDALIMGNGA